MTKETNEHCTWHWRGKQLHLLKEKALWLAEERCLLVADTHFGKAGHFRKSGIPIPESVHGEDFAILQQLILKYKPCQFIFLGDLFHSEYNQTWDQILDFIQLNNDVSFHLIKGNHDVLPEKLYQNSQFTIHPECLRLGKLFLSHEPQDQVPEGFLNVCGHLHPGVSIKGTSKQRIKLPCFFYRENCLVMPAFGKFTGLMTIHQDKASCIMVTTGEAVIPIKLNNKVG